MNDANTTWLPNLVGGVSIWKLAVDLNEPKYFDGRLLVPETEGSESLPVMVRWDLSGLIPLNEARSKHANDVAAALNDFGAALERVAKVFSTPDSGFDKYKQAFTVPSVDADDGANYFYSRERRKIFVINWGASPRSMAGRAEHVFGYEDWGRALTGKGGVDASATDRLAAGAAVGAGVSAAIGAAGGAAAGVNAAESAEQAAQKKETKPGDEKKRPWWMWPLFALIAIAIVLLALFLLKACERSTTPNADGGEAGAEASSDGASDGATPGDTPSDAATSGDAMADASARDAGDSGADAGGADAGSDGGSASNEEEEDDEPGGGGGGGGGGSSGGGGKVVVTLGGAGGGAGPAAKSGPHRRHYQAEATKWRIAAGNDKVARSEQRGQRFDVWLGSGKTFQGVGVEWQDKTGKWHAH